MGAAFAGTRPHAPKFDGCNMYRIDYSCSNIGIVRQPKKIRCVRRADEKTK